MERQEKYSNLYLQSLIKEINFIFIFFLQINILVYTSEFISCRIKKPVMRDIKLVMSANVKFSVQHLSGRLTDAHYWTVQVL